MEYSTESTPHILFTYQSLNPTPTARIILVSNINYVHDNSLIPILSSNANTSLTSVRYQSHQKSSTHTVDSLIPILQATSVLANCSSYCTTTAYRDNINKHYSYFDGSSVQCGQACKHTSSGQIASVLNLSLVVNTATVCYVFSGYWVRQFNARICQVCVSDLCELWKDYQSTMVLSMSKGESWYIQWIWLK